MNNPSFSQDTIYALASAHGSAGVSVIRVSGEQSHDIGCLLTGKEELRPRYALFADVLCPKTKTLIDKALLIYFKAPNSFTGEDILEIHVHGSPAIIHRLFDILEGMPYVRMAEPGEFSKRAYLNDKMDLTEAEAISDLVVAETQAQADQALAQMNGSLRDLYEGWRHDLLRSLAYVEADIDFADDDIPDNLAQMVLPKIKEIHQSIQYHVNDDNKGEIIRNGIRVAVIGAPNAGKSSLMNGLTKRDVAIVSDIAGTTRDVLETHLNIGGYPVILMDTAGLRETDDVVEKIGVSKALSVLEQADLKLALFDVSIENLDKTTFDLIDDKTIVVLNKIDKTVNKDAIEAIKSKPCHATVEISAKFNKNIDGLIAVFKQWVDKRFQGNTHSVTPTRERHRQHLQVTLEHFERAFGNDMLPELFAEDIRLAVRELGKITGRVDVEDLLDVIFRDFCLGK